MLDKPSKREVVAPNRLLNKYYTEWQKDPDSAWNTWNMSLNNSQKPLIGGSASLAWMLIIGGITGWVAALALTIERLNVAANPDAVLSCDVSPFISCKSVMLTWQASLLGFPNPLVGLAAFFAPVLIGVAILAGASFAKWFWQLFTLGVFGGFVFVIWLFTQSLFVIGALCPYCMVAWAGMIPMFWKQFLFATSEGIVPVPLKMTGFFVAAYDWHWLFTFATFSAIIGTAIWRFWDLWPSLF